jgi:hypothetical protein
LADAVYLKVLEGVTVQAVYEARTDTLSIIPRAEAMVESDEDEPGVILDYDEYRNLISLDLKILDASRRTTETHRIEFETVG